MPDIIENFCRKHGACREGREWALANCQTSQDVWQRTKPEWIIWIATRQGVLSDRELRLFAVFCARQVEHLLTDQRSRDAIAVAERFANGEASVDELAAARDAARDAAWLAAWDAARAAADAAWDAAWTAGDAAWAAAEAAEAAADAAEAGDAADAAEAGDAARAAQAEWLRENTRPNFELGERR